ncbi:hypothetical protein C8F01DRAFT_1234718 [Mycena amicta]|nr:hypothetical protein C8F01DRAFT_1234718 [Mycena amicta]
MQLSQLLQPSTPSRHIKSQNTNQDLHAGSAQAQFPSVVSLSLIAQLSGSQPTDPMMDDGEEGPDGPTLGDTSVTIQMAACLPVHGHEVSGHARLTHLTHFSNASTPEYHYVDVALKARRTDRHRLECGGGERPSDDDEPRRRRRWMDLDGENRRSLWAERWSTAVRISMKHPEFRAAQSHAEASRLTSNAIIQPTVSTPVTPPVKRKRNVQISEILGKSKRKKACTMS